MTRCIVLDYKHVFPHTSTANLANISLDSEKEAFEPLVCQLNSLKLISYCNAHTLLCFSLSLSLAKEVALTISSSNFSNPCIVFALVSKYPIHPIFFANRTPCSVLINFLCLVTSSCFLSTPSSLMSHFVAIRIIGVSGQ